MQLVYVDNNQYTFITCANKCPVDLYYIISNFVRIIFSRKSRAKSDKETKDEEAAKEEEGPSEVIFTPPGDANLMKYIEDVTEKIQPLPTSRDQVSAVAQ